MASKLHPAFLHKTHSAHHVERATREGSTAHTSTSCAAVQAKAARGTMSRSSLKKPRPLDHVQEGNNRESVCLSTGKGARCSTTALADGLLKGSHQEKVLNSLLSNHNRSTLFLKTAVPRATANHQGCSRLMRGWENHKLSVHHITQLNQDWVERQAGQQFTKN